jgi:hypothetical protein
MGRTKVSLMKGVRHSRNGGPGPVVGTLKPLTSFYESFILMYMSKRLQVLLEESELAEIRRAARLSRMTVAEWVRQALRRARREEPVTDTKRKIAMVREAARGEYPTADIGQMLAEIERGYSSDVSPPS